LRNWEIWVTAQGVYDAHACHPGPVALFVPYHLLRMRLWSPFLVFMAVLLISVMLGWILGVLVQVIAWLYFWRAAPTLMRQDFVARGFRLWRVVAVRSEAELHAQLSKTAPNLRFAHARLAASDP